MDAFGVDPLIYQGEIYDAINDFTSDLPFYRKWCEISGGSVLELCCGTGRITIPLAKAGVEVTGLDFTESMLSVARQKAMLDSVDVTWILGDIREFHLGRVFDLILIPFNSLQNIYSTADVQKVFSRVKAHLKPGGYFIFSVFNPSLEYIVDCSRSPRIYRKKLPDGRELTISESCVYDSAHQVNCFTWLHKFSGSDEEFPQRLDMRCFYPLEMDALLHYNGWQVIHKFGKFDEELFHAASPYQIYVCQWAGR